MILHSLEYRFLTMAYCDAAEPWQLGFQDAATPIMQGIIDVDPDIFFFLILILVFVLWMLIRILWHFNEKTHPIPQRIVHGTTIEIIWTIFPSIILMFIAIPSFALFYSMDEVVVDPAVTVKIKASPNSFWGDICGTNRAFMPIVVEAVSLKDYGSWIPTQIKGGVLGGGVASHMDARGCGVDLNKMPLDLNERPPSSSQSASSTDSAPSVQNVEPVVVAPTPSREEVLQKCQERILACWRGQSSGSKRELAGGLGENVNPHCLAEVKPAVERFLREKCGPLSNSEILTLSKDLEKEKGNSKLFMEFYATTEKRAWEK